jgi:hypothetical protein
MIERGSFNKTGSAYFNKLWSLFADLVIDTIRDYRA